MLTRELGLYSGIVLKWLAYVSDALFGRGFEKEGVEG